MEAAIAIIVAAGVFIAVFIDQKKKDRAAEAVGTDHLCVAIERTVGDVANSLRGTQLLLGKMRSDIQDQNAALAPLCESLAESLTQRMSTIDGDMADLRTRVERATGTSTMSL